MAENEIITQQDPQMQMFAQLMEGILKKLERYCATARPCWVERFTSLVRRFAANYGSAHVRSKSTEMQEYFLSTKSEGRYFTNRATYKQCLKGIITQYPRNYGKNR